MLKVFSIFIRNDNPPEIVRKINREVNSEIKYAEDRDQYKVSDIWVVNPESGFGDCEDYALTKQSRLFYEGIPLSDLDIQLCQYRDRTNKLIWHAVLVYKNIWVLDNKTDIIWQKKDLKNVYFNWNPNEGKRVIYDKNSKNPRK